MAPLALRIRRSGPQIVTGYFGTSVPAADAIRRNLFSEADQRRGALGRGVYLLQDAPGAAAARAELEYGTDAAVLAVQVRLDACLDLVDPIWIKTLRHAYEQLVALQQLPTEGGRLVDGTVVSYCLSIATAPTPAPSPLEFSSIRAALVAGSALFPGSGLAKVELQVMLRNNNAIMNVEVVSNLA